MPIWLKDSPAYTAKIYLSALEMESSGIYTKISFIVQFRRLQRASKVLVETDSPPLSLLIVELLMFPLACRV